MSKPITRQPNASWIPNPAEFQRHSNRPPHPANPVSSASSSSGPSNLMSVINNSAAISSGAGQWSSMGTGSNPTSMANSSVSFLYHNLRTLENTFHLILNVFQMKHQI